MDIKNILMSIINEAQNGQINIDGEMWPIGFNTCINGQLISYNEHNLSTLVIKDMNSLVDLLKKYIDVEVNLKRKSLNYFKNNNSYVKFLLAYLFVNASVDDFNNFNNYVIKYINFLQDNTLNTYNDGKSFSMNLLLNDKTLFIQNKKQSVMMETPNKMEFQLRSKYNPSLVYALPEISYGIETKNGKKICYIYSILNKETKEDKNIESLKFKKDISRLLYKLNSNMIKEEINESNKYVMDVSVSSVLSLYVFLNIIKDRVDVVKAVPYLPLRYLSRELVKEQYVDQPDLYNEKDERNNRIQNNATNKFINTFERVSLHTDFFNINAYPYEIDEYLTGSLNCKKEKITNEFIESIDSGIKK